MPPLATERLTLVPITPEIARAAAGSKPELAKLLGVAIHPEWPNQSYGEILPWIAQRVEVDPTYGEWCRLVIHAGDGLLMGDAGFHTLPGPDGTVEIGYGIVPAYRGQGYAYETARALVDWAFTHEAVTRVVARVEDLTNHSSVRILERLGMRLVGRGDGLNFERARLTT
jgi:[ribosomal protein S5]-alanine N-acetyltransferase